MEGDFISGQLNTNRTSILDVHFYCKITVDHITCKRCRMWANM